MTTTTNLGITELTSAQNNKEVTINDALEALDQGTQGTKAHTITGNTTVSAADFTGFFSHQLSGSPAAFNFTVPLTKRLFRVANATGVMATVKGATGATVALQTGSEALLFCDGTDIKLVSHSLSPQVVKMGNQAGATATVDVSQGRAFTMTLTGDNTIAFSNVPSDSGFGATEIAITATQDGTGSRALAWPGSVTWAEGVAPHMPQAAAATATFFLRTTDSGTTWLGRGEGAMQPSKAVNQGSLSGTETLDLSAGMSFYGELTGNTTFAFSEVPAAGFLVLTLRVKQDGTGGRTITWPGSVSWAGGAPVISTAADAVAVFRLYSIDGGTAWFGVVEGSATKPDRVEAMGTPGTGTITVEVSRGEFTSMTLDQNTTIAFASVPAAGCVAVSLLISQNGTGGWTLTWPASVKWSGGTIPTFPAAASADALYELVTVDGGTTWRGRQFGASFA